MEVLEKTEDMETPSIPLQLSGDMSLNTAQKHWPSALRHGHLEHNPTPITYPPLPDINDHDPYTPLSQHRVSVSMLQRLQLACLASLI